MSIYTIYTKKTSSNEDFEIIFKKYKEKNSLEIKSLSNNEIIIKDNQTTLDIKNELKHFYIPEIFIKSLESTNFYEVLLFRNNEIFKTEWTFNELSDFDKNLYKNYSYEIINELKENKIKYEFNIVYNNKYKEHINLKIYIKLGKEIYKNLKFNKLNIDNIKSIPPVKKLIDNLYNNYINEYEITFKTEDRSLIIDIGSNEII